MFDWADLGCNFRSEGAGRMKRRLLFQHYPYDGLKSKWRTAHANIQTRKTRAKVRQKDLVVWEICHCGATTATSRRRLLKASTGLADDGE